MQRKTNGRRTPSTRRAFLQSAGALTAGLVTSANPSRAAGETLAVLGGQPTVIASGRQHAEASRWPRYGTEEEKAVLDLLRNPSYGPIAALEKDWKDRFQVPFVKAHC